MGQRIHHALRRPARRHRSRSAIRPRWRCSARRSIRFAYTADVKSAFDDARHINLPNLAIFLWRLAAYRLPRCCRWRRASPISALSRPAGRFALRFDLHPLDHAGAALQHQPRPILQAGHVGRRRLAADRGRRSAWTDARCATHQRAPAGHPDAYVQVDFFDDAAAPPTGFDLAATSACILFMPQSWAARCFSAQPSGLALRGDNLCAWETGLRRPLRSGEIVIDPDIGRVLIGLDTAAQRDALVTAAGPAPRMFVELHLRRSRAGRRASGLAEPCPIAPVPSTCARSAPCPAAFTAGRGWPSSTTATQPVVIEIHDSLVHHARPVGALPGTAIDGGVVAPPRAIADDSRGRRAAADRAAGPAARVPAGVAAAAHDRSHRRCGSKACTSRVTPATFPGRAGADHARRGGASRAGRLHARPRRPRAARRNARAAPTGDSPDERLRLRDARRRHSLRADARHRHPALDHRCAGHRRPLPPRHRRQHRRCRPRRRRSADRRLRDRRRHQSRAPPGARRSTSTA